MKAENVRPVCLGSRSFCFQAVFVKIRVQEEENRGRKNAACCR